MKKISVLTATRAEYGLLKPIIKKLNNVSEFDVRVVVTGAHLSPEFGLTYKEIEKDGISIDQKLEMLLSADTPAAISKSMGIAMISFADYFEQLKPDLLIVLGDRYETLAVSTVAMNQRIPIAHLYGGETTEGAVDESVRHAISKLSYLHYTSTEEYRNRVIQLGEHPDRVLCVGAIGIENILNERLMSKSELASSINFNLDRPYAIVTFHPVTLEDNNTEKQMQTLLEVCKTYPNMNFIFTKANADRNGRIINQMIDSYIEENQNAKAFTSLGMTRYLSALKFASMVIGNSSSGLVEAPSFGIPTINIGDRQKGRIQAESIISCEPKFLSVKNAIDLALTDEFKNRAKRVVNPYGDGRTSEKVVSSLKEVLLENRIELKKKFHDLG
ncbi:MULTISPECIES: UDP-N-acetylglucosamine 2-epimerase [unclassified Mesobacillus]|uniref:UDP-N-acetylglucosamine 2-epimerase n=1 Tax=unclassified Mesobacillus TaxID=2675270 RepID=UPI0020418982|nr:MULTISPECIES: UDP-N-acetylglucosamine 2-epimerase [unclassified Mesobacillus]MCM3124161.1 UDP-N-acetylglucosamine 2-epimerase [Mesobacillus sp. MER 33]MCM3234010.1 UDP-N-acetylglucosamine 2-epimerase [Mesobacillus sp. MER 48]